MVSSSTKSFVFEETIDPVKLVLGKRRLGRDRRIVQTFRIRADIVSPVKRELKV